MNSFELDLVLHFYLITTYVYFDERINAEYVKNVVSLISTGGCSGFGAWVFNAVFNVSLLALFVNFYSKNYGRGEGGEGKKVRRKRDE